MDSPSPPPTFADRGQVLGDLTHLLGGTLSDEARLRLDPSVAGRRHYWEALIELATQYRLTAALWSALLREGLAVSPPAALRPFLPAGSVAIRLENDWFFNRKRLGDLEAQARKIIAALNAAGISPMLLKGMSHVFADLYADPASRWMVDVDMLIRAEELAGAQAVMTSLGYRPKADDKGAPHHLAPLFLEGHWGSIELHFMPLLPPADGALPAADAWRDAVAVEKDGLSYFHLSPDHLLLHNVIGGQVSDWGYATLTPPLRSLSDFVALARKHGAAIDWARMEAMAEAAGYRGHFEAHLIQAERLFGLVRAGARPYSLAARAHWLLCAAAARWPWPVRRLAVTLKEFRYAYSAESLSHLGLWQGGNEGLARARARLFARHLRQHRLGLGLLGRLSRRP
ncbi:MAG: nucleotidyltransferase family protein [Parvibaculum sp.]|uniref:nucleotidyltransferase family protein n=1 Tax=Parvibaculum sp. TaxID=2024848 RepID=UPI00284ED4E7|nr:nucleotidyltransferase family protein [Parvibaculum sp.]MDR3500186.1 nucleotidyltransferase family protein [Parvibaculum sp.]